MHLVEFFFDKWRPPFPFPFPFSSMVLQLNNTKLKKVEHFSHNFFNDEHWNTMHYWFDDVKIELSNHLQKLH
jgi:hypothetical protein